MKTKKDNFKSEIKNKGFTVVMSLITVFLFLAEVMVTIDPKHPQVLVKLTSF